MGSQLKTHVEALCLRETVIRRRLVSPDTAGAEGETFFRVPSAVERIDGARAPKVPERERGTLMDAWPRRRPGCRLPRPCFRQTARPDGQNLDPLSIVAHPESEMTRTAQIAVVVAGYAAAIGAAAVAGWAYNWRVSKLPYDTSGGMYAGGEMITSLAAFLFVALFPTLLALWFLRANEKFWNAVAVASLAFAAIGLLAVLLPVVTASTRSVALGLIGLVGIAQLLGAPLWLLSFGLFAWLAPTPWARRKLISAVALEAVIGVVALAHWFMPHLPR